MMKIGIISSYPPKNSRHTIGDGISSYTKNLIENIKNSLNDYEIEIFANRLANIKSKYVEQDIAINRCWSKDARYILQIYENIKNSHFDIIHIQFEFFLYGGVTSIVLFPMLLLLFKIKNIKTIVTIHQVVQLSKLDHNFVRENAMKGPLLLQKFGLYFFMKAIVRISDKVIVHEEDFKNVLHKEYKCPLVKIIVIPHGIEDKNNGIDSEEAKNLLKLDDRRIILYFGYLAGYKGLNNLIQSFQFLNSNLTLIVAGGEPLKLKNNPEHMKRILNLKSRADKISKHIIFTGFVEEKMIPIYFSAADVAVFPYSTRFSSSGTLSLAIAYEKPFLLSDSFRTFIPLSNVIFENEPISIAKKIEDFFNNKNIIQDTLNCSKKLKSENSWKNIANITINTYTCVIKNSFIYSKPLPHKQDGPLKFPSSEKVNYSGMNTYGKNQKV